MCYFMHDLIMTESLREVLSQALGLEHARAGLRRNEALFNRQRDTMAPLNTAHHGLNETPVDGLQPLVHILVAVVSKVAMVSVLPEVDDEQGGDTTTTNGVSGVKGVDNLKLTVVVDEPSPASTKHGLGVGLGVIRERMMRKITEVEPSTGAGIGPSSQNGG